MQINLWCHTHTLSVIKTIRHLFNNYKCLPTTTSYLSNSIWPLKCKFWSSLCNKYIHTHTHTPDSINKGSTWLENGYEKAHSGAVRHYLLFLTYNSVETSTCKYKPNSRKWTGATFISKLWGICEFLMGRLFSRKRHRQHQRTSGISRSQTRLHSFLLFKANGGLKMIQFTSHNLFVDFVWFVVKVQVIHFILVAVWNWFGVGGSLQGAFPNLLLL